MRLSVPLALALACVSGCSEQPLEPLTATDSSDESALLSAQPLHEVSLFTSEVSGFDPCLGEEIQGTLTGKYVRHSLIDANGSRHYRRFVNLHGFVEGLSTGRTWSGHARVHNHTNGTYMQTASGGWVIWEVFKLTPHGPNPGPALEVVTRIREQENANGDFVVFLGVDEVICKP